MAIDVLSNNILLKIKSTDPKFVLAAIERIRESGNNSILVELIELLHNTKHTEIKKNILRLLSELKDKESVPVLTEAITNKKYTNECKDLVTCCWQNGLSYNEYLPVFIDLVIHEEFPIAFEAFTVIENMYGNIEDEIIEQEIAKINDAIKEIKDKHKVNLLNGLLTIIRDIPQEQELTN